MIYGVDRMTTTPYWSSNFFALGLQMALLDDQNASIDKLHVWIHSLSIQCSSTFRSNSDDVNAMIQWQITNT
jgi:hypothetical protein